MFKIIAAIVAVTCGIFALLGIFSIALGLAFVYVSIWIQEKMEDVNDS
jgi:hypothetical protein